MALYEGSAILLGRYGGKYLSLPGSEHVALYAPTRSGKGVSCVIPNCLTWPHSLVVLDVKRENWRASAGYRSQVLGQRTWLFDPLAPDGRTARFNPLACIDREAPDRFDQIQKVGQAFFPESKGNAKFWDDAARAAFNGVTCLVAETPALPFTVAQVLRLFTASWAPDYLKRTIEQARQAGCPYSLATVDSVSDYLGSDARLANDIRKTVSTRLALWNNPRIAAATESSDFDLGRLKAEPFSIYVAVNPGDIERLRPLLALLFQQLVTLNTRRLPDEDPDYRHPVLVLLDEFPTLGRMPVLAHAFAFVAGFGLRLLVVCQSRAQLRDAELYGPEMAANIFDNCGVEVVFGAKNIDLCEELSRRSGFNTVDSVTRNRPRFWSWLKWHRQSLAAHPHSRAMLLPQEVARLQGDQELLFRVGMQPVLAEKIRWFADPQLRERALQPPPVSTIDIAVPVDDGGLAGDKLESSQIVREVAPAQNRPRRDLSLRTS